MVVSEAFKQGKYFRLKNQRGGKGLDTNSVFQRLNNKEMFRFYPVLINVNDSETICHEAYNSRVISGND
jgi:hypothetical protein